MLFDVENYSPPAPQLPIPQPPRCSKAFCLWLTRVSTYCVLGVCDTPPRNGMALRPQPFLWFATHGPVLSAKFLWRHSRGLDQLQVSRLAVLLRMLSVEGWGAPFPMGWPRLVSRAGFQKRAPGCSRPPEAHRRRLWLLTRSGVGQSRSEAQPVNTRGGNINSTSQPKEWPRHKMRGGNTEEGPVGSLCVASTTLRVCWPGIHGGGPGTPTAAVTQPQLAARRAT